MYCLKEDLEVGGRGLIVILSYRSLEETEKNSENPK
jgi:hypothetical protein